jgi:hypothetical protein
MLTLKVMIELLPFCLASMKVSIFPAESSVQ